MKMSPIPEVPRKGDKIKKNSKEKFQVFILEKIHVTKCYIIKFLVNIWNHGKNLQDLSGQNP